MFRTRLVWFTVGFSASAAAITQLVWRDLLFHRSVLSSQMTENLSELQARVRNLENSFPPHKSESTQVEA